MMILRILKYMKMNFISRSHPVSRVLIVRWSFISIARSTIPRILEKSALWKWMRKLVLEKSWLKVQV